MKSRIKMAKIHIKMNTLPDLLSTADFQCPVPSFLVTDDPLDDDIFDMPFSYVTADFLRTIPKWDNVHQQLVDTKYV